MLKSGSIQIPMSQLIKEQFEIRLDFWKALGTCFLQCCLYFFSSPLWKFTWKQNIPGYKTYQSFMYIELHQVGHVSHKVGEENVN